jgi:hypothetical protein
MRDDIDVSRVGPDPLLSGDEKETTLSMYGLDKQYTIHSAKPTIIKALLQHDEFTLTRARVVDGEDVSRVTTREDLRKTPGAIVQIVGQLPVGTLTIKSKPRANNHQSSIVNYESVDPAVFNRS